MNLKRSFRYYYLKIIRLKGNPQSLARGAAIGAFMAIMPIMPVRTIVIIFSTAFIKASTLAALIIATIISNPLTYVPLYYFAVITGNAITPYTLNWERVEKALNILLSSTGYEVPIQTVASLGMEAFIVLMMGGMLLAIPVSLLTYGLSLYFFSTRKIVRKNNS